MTEKAPERIWAFYAPELAEDNCGGDILAHDTVQHGGQPYTRTDLCDAVVAERDELRAEVERLKAAQPVVANQDLDWVRIGEAANRHNVRFPTNNRLVLFIDEVIATTIRKGTDQ